ncbi:NAD(P)/FAD-dependent oxidoreductase, partial [Sulfolobus sp. C3]
MKKYDVIIIGGGHNGLIASIYLAMNGLKTIVLERREKLGGMADTDEYKGVKFSKAAYVLGL